MWRRLHLIIVKVFVILADYRLYSTWLQNSKWNSVPYFNNQQETDCITLCISDKLDLVETEITHVSCWVSNSISDFGWWARVFRTFESAGALAHLLKPFSVSGNPLFDAVDPLLLKYGTGVLWFREMPGIFMNSVYAVSSAAHLRIYTATNALGLIVFPVTFYKTGYIGWKTWGFMYGNHNANTRIPDLVIVLSVKRLAVLR